MRSPRLLRHSPPIRRANCKSLCRSRAGGSADFFARTVFNKIAPLIGYPIVIENKAGASGIVGAKAVISASPDGYTLLVSAVASVIIPPSLTDPPAFDPLKDLTPITGIGTVPAVLVVKPSLGIRTFGELLAYAKANPSKLNLASSGTGTISHLTAELLMRETGINIQHVPYRGAPPAVTDLLGGHADIMFSDAPFFLEHIQTAKLIPLAVGTATSGTIAAECADDSGTRLSGHCGV